MRSQSINKQKDAKNEVEYEEPSNTHEVPIYLNIFECGRNILNTLDITYERACMATPKEKYYTNFWKLQLTIMIITMHHCPMRSFDKQSVQSL